MRHNENDLGIKFLICKAVLIRTRWNTHWGVFGGEPGSKHYGTRRILPSVWHYKAPCDLARVRAQAWDSLGHPYPGITYQINYNILVEGVSPLSCHLATWQLQGHLSWHGKWGHSPLGPHQWGRERSGPSEGLWWSQSVITEHKIWQQGMMGGRHCWAWLILPVGVLWVCALSGIFA